MKLKTPREVEAFEAGEASAREERDAILLRMETAMLEHVAGLNVEKRLLVEAADKAYKWIMDEIQGGDPPNPPVHDLYVALQMARTVLIPKD